MSRYNKLSRSRSKERYLEENNERTKYEDINREKEEEINRKIERMRDEERANEKEWERERQIYLRREKDLLDEIDRIKSIQTLNRFQRPFIPNRNFQRFNPRPNQFSNFNKTIQFINPRNRFQYQERRNNFINNNNTTSSELNKIIYNFDKDNNRSNITETQKFKKKIYLPRTQGYNLVGLILGPKGNFQKYLEKETDCKIYINGQNMKKKETYINPYDNDRMHVLIIGRTEEKVQKAAKTVEDIIYADEKTRNKLMQKQLKVAQKEGDNINFIKSDDHLMTPYGPPSDKARFYKVPNDFVGLIIGANGENVKRIMAESNCKIQAANSPIPNTNLRYIFIEGTEENYQIAVRMIEKTIGDNANRK